MEDEKRWKVYVHTNIENGKRYVGITSRQKAESRWMNGRGYKENPHFRDAINKYGWNGFTHDVIFTDLTCEEAKEKERQLISEWNTQDKRFGYNMTSGGDGTPNYHPSAETRAKQSFARMRENLSEETRRRKSEAMHNRKLTSEHKQKIGEGNSKSIDMLDMSGNYIMSFYSATEAECKMKINHSHISQCCTNKRKSTGGYMWRFTQ